MDEQRKKRVQISDPLAEVRVSPVRVNGSSVANKGIEILNNNGEWECINVHSSSYNLIPNTLAAKTTGQILDESSLSWEPTSEIWTGRYWAKLYKSDMTVEASKVGDTLSLGLRVENSYDGSCGFRIQLMAFVLSCENGLVSPKNFTSYKLRHSIGNGNQFVTDEAASVIRSGLDELIAVVPMVERLNDIPLSIELLSQVSRETGLPNGMLGLITKELKDANTAWNLFQAFTHHLTFNGRGKSALLHQEAVGDYFLSRLIA